MSILHFRGDTCSMFVFFLLLFAGLMQLLVAWKRLSGLSLTGYPDRRIASSIAGALLVTGACAWYFAGDGHFAAPDVEGMETLLLLSAGLLAAVAVQFLLSSILFRHSYSGGSACDGRALPGQGVKTTGFDLSVASDSVPALWVSSSEERSSSAALLLHDYGSDMRSLILLAERLAMAGTASLLVDLDGHGGNPRDISDSSMRELVDSALRCISGSREGSIFAAGSGLGGLLCLLAASDRPEVSRAVALDPPSRDPGGDPAVNCLRELKPPDAIRAFLFPAGAREGCKGVLLSDLIRGLPDLRAEGSLVVGTEGAFYNAPQTLSSYAESVTGRPAALVRSRHATVAHEPAALDAAAAELGEVTRGPRARKA